MTRMPLHRRLLRILFYAAIAALAIPPLLVLPLRWVNPPTSAYMLRTHWETGAEIHYQWIDLKKIAPVLPLAVIASEDQTFPTHNGFAWESIRKAIVASLHGEPLRGASTITQQTAKNLFLWPARSWIRKGIEAYITVWMEILLSKQRIIELYLNIAQFNTTTFGARAAARRIFDTTASQLTRGQAALLAALLPAPTEYSARHPSAYIRQRKRWILRQMRHLGMRHLRGIYPFSDP